MSFAIDTKIIQNKQVMPGFYCMDLDAPDVAKRAKPGQFLHVRCGATYDPLLRRPISIHAVDRQAGKVSLLYRVAGRGTVLLAERRSGDIVSIIGPLGHGFTTPEADKKVFVVSGGIGIAPLYFLLQELAGLGIKATIFQGFATAEQVFLVEEIRNLGHNVELATDDGSRGFNGYVTRLFEDYLQNIALHKGQTGLTGHNSTGNRQQEATDANSANCVFACGPRGMLREVSEITARWQIPCEISLEERMGCGVGACLSCACKIDNGDGIAYRRVCIEGPVFPSGEVSWE